MPARELSDGQRKWLEKQLAGWTGQDLVTADQAARILATYESAEEVGHRKRSYFSFVIIGLAAVMVGLALFLLIGYNWDAIPYRAWGVALAAGTLVPLSFGEFNKEILRYGNYGYSAPAYGGLLQLAPLVVLVAATLVIGAYFIRPAAGTKLSPGERLLELARRQWLPLGLSVGLAAMSLWSMANVGGEEGSWLVPTIVANVAMIGMSLWLLRVGLNEDRGRPFTFGVVYFLLWAILRYCDLFAAAGGMLGAALMFFLCGAALFGVGMFWRGRKEAHHV